MHNNKKSKPKNKLAFLKLITLKENGRQKMTTFFPLNKNNK
tara:strand:- start:398 stop:520 length:123 start_codon:yes stop_codon:yes gene_type:complete